MKDKVFIYLIQYSKEDFIYIGSTVRLKDRFSLHKKYGTAVHDMDMLKKNKLTFTILDEVNRNTRYEWEGFYMDLFKSWNFKLKNKQRLLNSNRLEMFYNRKTKKNDKI